MFTTLIVLATIWCIFTLAQDLVKQCSSNIYCQGPLLDAVQKSGLFADSKTFVDMPAMHSEKIILERFARLPRNPSLASMRAFVDENFEIAGNELKEEIPVDWLADIDLYKKLNKQRLKEFAKTVHMKWLKLGRRFEQTCLQCPHSSLSLNYPFIVPGGRFREFYYWDTYWIVEGLLVSGMCRTVSDIIENMLEMVREFGFIPNGSRVYYLNRSQPPLLIDMIESYCRECLNTDKYKEFIQGKLPLMVKEYNFWIKHRSVSVKHLNNTYNLNVYRADQDKPRPESYKEDTIIAPQSAKNNALFYKNVASAAESGWDFSSRWFAPNDPSAILTIQTVDIVPVDLNSVLYSNELKLSKYYALANDQKESEKYEKLANDRRQAMSELMFDGDMWTDYDLAKRAKRPGLYISSMAPHWFHLTSGNVSAAFDTLLLPSGYTISSLNSGQQWDYPNVWAPVQHRQITWLIEQSRRPEALDLAKRFLGTCHCGYVKYGMFFEKYHGELVGEPGGGGEYVVQEGFGWTNGVLLYILNEFGDELDLPTTCPKYEMNFFENPDIQTDKIVIGGLLVCCTFMGCIVGLLKFGQWLLGGK